MRAGHALLLQDAQGRPRRDWIGLFSVAFVKDAIRSAEPRIGSDAVLAIRSACDVILGEASDTFSSDDHTRHAAILGGIADHIQVRPSTTFSLKQALWLLQEKRVGIPRPSAGTAALRGLRILAESWRPDRLDHDGVRRAEQAARKLLEAAIALQSRVIETIAGAARPLANAPGYGRAGRTRPPVQAAAMAIATRV